MKMFGGKYRWWMSLLLMVWAVATAYADDPPQVKATPSRFIPAEGGAPDSLDLRQQQTNARIYDSIRVKSGRSRFAKMLYSSLIRPVRDTTSRGRIVDETRQLARYAGKRIHTISIERLRPFNADGNWLQRTANNLHNLTNLGIIQRELMFAEGEPFDPDLVVRNKQLLQSRRNIADVDVRVMIDTLDTTQVHVVIRTRDSWTIDVDAGLHSGHELSVGLSELNMWGRGHELRLETNFNYRNFRYGGNVVEYRVPNMFGSFYEFEFQAGRAFNRSRFGVDLQHKFLKKTDYMVGVEYLRSKEKHRYYDRDTTELVNSRRFNLWGGYSHYFPSIHASLYATGRYHYQRFLMRPEDTSPTHHPLLHDRDLALASVGLYREDFHSATMIYGYGKREYLSSGFRTELTAGYQWGEFGNDLYLGLSHTMGGFAPFGYLMGRIDAGSYIDRQHDWHRTAIDAQIRWFSNLLRSRRTSIRQFVGLSYAQGWGRLTGADEWLRYTEDVDIPVLDENILGNTRMVLNVETVLFTPYEPLGFKVAFFTFFDAGLLGYHDNVFKNDPYFALGFGVRVRNERLVFRTLQLRLGIAFGRHGWADSNWIYVSSEPDLQQYRYMPQYPDVLIYR